MSSQHSIYDRSYQFSLRVVNLCRTLKPDLTSRSLISQLVRSATSITANLNEADAGITRKDFTNKIVIALKEARETTYWLQLLSDSDYIDPTSAQSLIQESVELSKILGKIKINTQATTS